MGKQRRASWSGQELENEDVDDNVALIARELEKGLREISTGRERKCLRLVTDAYLRVGDYTSKTKQDPLFLHIYSKREDALYYLVSKLVAGVL